MFEPESYEPVSLVGQLPYHNVLNIHPLVSAAAMWLHAKFLDAGPRKDGGCLPNRLTPTDKLPGIFANTDPSRPGAIVPIRPCPGGCLI